MSDEQRKEEEAEVEGHVRGPHGGNQSPEVEAHVRGPHGGNQSNEEPRDETDDGDVEAHVRTIK